MTDFLQLAGLASLVAAAFVFSLALGLAVLGVALLVVSLGIGKA